jgi:hypothetical protein
MIYGTASFYHHLRVGRAESPDSGANPAAAADGAYLAGLSAITAEARGRRSRPRDEG